jgi:hypothetical protein
MRGKDGLEIYFDPKQKNHDTSVAKVGANASGSATVVRSRAPHARRFLRLLDECCAESGTHLFGYCIEPNEATFLIRASGAPLEAVMQRLGGSYSRYLHLERVLPRKISAFASRYESKLVAPEYLLHALRRVHGAALRAGWVGRAVDYPLSSAAAYAGERAQVHLKADFVRRALELKGLFGLRGYLEFMEQPESPHVRSLFDEGSSLDARIVGRPVFVAQTHDAALHPKPKYTRERLLAAVRILLKSEHSASLFSEGSQRVLARALVAWFALKTGSATVREVGEWFGVSAAALGKAIRHYRRVSPALFWETLPGLDRDYPADD